MASPPGNGATSATVRYAAFGVPPRGPPEWRPLSSAARRAVNAPQSRTEPRGPFSRIECFRTDVPPALSTLAPDPASRRSCPRRFGVCADLAFFRWGLGL